MDLDFKTCYVDLGEGTTFRGESACFRAKVDTGIVSTACSAQQCEFFAELFATVFIHSYPQTLLIFTSCHQVSSLPSVHVPLPSGA